MVVPDVDVIVVGSGPAGASAALELGRARRQVLLIDGGMGRNGSSRAAHGLYSRDGCSPAELHRIACEQLARYEVRVINGLSQTARAVPGGFEVTLQDGTVHTAARLLLAYGVRDLLPEVPGLRERWGSSVLHCPYCDGYEYLDQRAVVYGQGNPAHHMALTLQPWTRHVAVLTGGPHDFTPEQLQVFERLGLPLIETPVARLEGRGVALERVVLRGGEVLEADLMVLSPRQQPASDLGEQLGCRQEGSHLWVSETGETSVPGVYAAGDLTGPPQYVVAAASKGTLTAIALNTSLIHERLERRGVEFHKRPHA